MEVETSEEQIQENEDNYDRLIVAIESSRGMLSLLVASCNDRAFRDVIIQRYETELAETMRCYRVQLNSQEPSLRSALEQLVTENSELQAGNVAVLTVTGAEDLLAVALGNGKAQTEVDRFFGYLQWTREGLREYPFAIVVWVTPNILRKMSFKAPDFWSWRTGVFRFVAAEAATFTPSIKTNELQWRATEELESLPLDELLLSAQQIEAQKGSQAPALATLYDRLGRAYSSRVRAGKAENLQEEIELSIEYFQKAIDLQKMLGDKLNIANTLTRLGNFYNELGRYKQAVSTYQESLEIAREIGDRGGEADSLNNLGLAYNSLGQYNRAIDFHQQSLVMQQEIGDRRGEANSLNNLGNAYKSLGQYNRVKSRNIAARVLALAAQWLNEIAFGQRKAKTKAASAQLVLAVDGADGFENRAVVVEEIHPNCVGRVHFQSTDWPARCDLEITLPCGEIVCVVDRENLTLFVERL